jgi:hypothetical protein
LSRPIIPSAASANHPAGNCDAPEITSFVVKSDQLEAQADFTSMQHSMANKEFKKLGMVFKFPGWT